ncbi:hypothetical protein CMQ_7590 [Grosmannia clavigera kw1407]|uniref:Uncharacterized protein n=1 Tax=Grosmannia clavigera (strain kw1407 / UAMH 11150) TaxID=655863 RepID=F0XPE1_GROCL|nr:uncharacterized protein CMQ_7590 [Grosmannia clavigera kw1407]EFX00588.1 hypothetical protein CMQ_7590 [Grosmannia clavigera kw1407]
MTTTNTTKERLGPAEMVLDSPGRITRHGHAVVIEPATSPVILQSVQVAQWTSRPDDVLLSGVIVSL